MSGAASPTEWTYAEYARFPDDGNRYEVLEGEILTTPSPGTEHQRTASRLFLRLHEYVVKFELGEVMWDLDLLFVKGQFLRPDMMFVPRDRCHLLTDRGMEGTPALVVEIVSPSSGRIDKIKKPTRYSEFGVPEYWAVDPQRRAVLVWYFDLGATEPQVESERVIWQPEPDVPPLTLDLSSLFAGP